MRPVRSVLAALALCSLAAALIGCDTTRDKSERAKIFADRSLDSRNPVVVKRQFKPITVDRVQTVGRGKQALIVVQLSNTSSNTYAALPINVRSGSKLLNRGPEIPFFNNHVPAIGPDAEAIWIFKPGKRIRQGRLSAIVGKPNPNLSTGEALPELVAENVLITKGGVLGEVRNKSGTPQYSVEVYVTTSSRGRFTSAAGGRVVKLSSSGTRAFDIPVVGKPGSAKPQVSLGPAILVDRPSD